MKETGPQRAIEFHDGRYKGCVADGRLRRKGFEVFPEPCNKTAKLRRSLRNEIGMDRGLILADECLDLAFETSKFGGVERDLILPRCLPWLIAIERG